MGFTGKYVMTLDALTGDIREMLDVMLNSEDEEMRKGAKAQLDNTYIEFLSGGKFKMSLVITGNDGIIEGTFKEEGNTITISAVADGEASEMALTMEGNTVSMDISGQLLKLVKNG